MDGIFHISNIIRLSMIDAHGTKMKSNSFFDQNMNLIKG